MGGNFIKVKSITTAFFRAILHPRIELREIYFLLTKLILLFIVFDNARMGLQIPHLIGSIISLCRDCFMFLAILLLIVIKARIKCPKFIFFSLILLPVCILIYFQNRTFGATETTLSAVLNGMYWYIRPLLIFLIFYNIKSICGDVLFSYIPLFLNAISILFFTSALVYFCFPFILNKMYFEFRVSVGNPSMIAAEYNAAMILILCFRPFSNFKNSVLFFIYILACLGTMCATANFIMVLILFISLFLKCTRKVSLPCFFLLSSFLVAYFLVIGSAQTQILFKFVEKRFDEVISVIEKYIFRKSDSISSDSFRGREAQFSRMLATFPKEGFIFGIGDISGTGGKYSLENIYMATFSNYGLSGLIFYAFFILYLFTKSIYSLLKMKNPCFIMFVCFLSLYGLTLDLINTYSLSGIFVVSGFLLFTARPPLFSKNKSSLIFKYRPMYKE